MMSSPRVVEPRTAGVLRRAVGRTLGVLADYCLTPRVLGLAGTVVASSYDWSTLGEVRQQGGIDNRGGDSIEWQSFGTSHRWGSGRHPLGGRDTHVSPTEKDALLDDFARSRPGGGSPKEGVAPMDDARPQELSRRKVLVYALAASTLTLAAPLHGDLPPAEGAPLAAPAGRPPSVIAIGTDDEKLILEVTAANRIVVRLPRVEVGQGITTAVAMMIAEELDARLADIDIPLADANAGLNQYTGGSSSVSTLYDPARALAATARAKLVTAAARRWHLPARTLRTRDTMVIAPDGRTATFGSLSPAAAKVRTPDVPSKPKPPNKHRVIGRPATRIDARDLVTGKAKYAGDLTVAGAKPTVVARPPTVFGKIISVDSAAARAMPGVLAVVKIAGGVAVVAESFHHAFQARDALRITWAPGPLATWSDDKIRARLHAALPPLRAAPRGSTQVEGTFEFAFVSHAPMEVLTAVADVHTTRAEIWFSSQTPIDAQQSIAQAIGLPPKAVKVHVVRGGGSFGRRLNFEAAIEAALISKATRRPVKLMWSRSDDLTARPDAPGHPSPDPSQLREGKGGVFRPGDGLGE